MELLKEITEKDLGLSKETINSNLGYTIRRAARAVVLDQDDRVAIVWNGKEKHHKIPGGGIEAGEDIKTALAREIKEETGCQAQIIGEVGLIIEYKNQFEELQLSYCYLAKVIGEKEKPNFTQQEKAGGFRQEWVAFDEALALFGADKPAGYRGKFMWRRDFNFLLAAEEVLNIKNN